MYRERGNMGADDQATVLAGGDRCRTLLRDAETPSLTVECRGDADVTEKLDDSDCLTADTTTDWETLLDHARNLSIPVVLLTDEQTAVCDALDAGY